MAVVLTLVTNENKYAYPKIQKHSKYKYTYYQNTHTIAKHSHITKSTLTHIHTLQNPYMHISTYYKNPRGNDYKPPA